MKETYGKSTNGTPNWDKYVVNNNYEKVTYTIETETLFFKKQTNNDVRSCMGSTVQELNLNNSRTVNISASRDTGVTQSLLLKNNVQIGNKKGYVLINKINHSNQINKLVLRKRIFP